eukprot:TRINITY_DN47305_c0_g1_i1.p1 TRINITY_DN47305_c0_g1~~TRINITY_DN47305_c0_g1_i1.p1  ORF type:complete len:381 (+),score=71.21 TRINITY_DN47305_c0_g1_i1:52-1194(+)
MPTQGQKAKAKAELTALYASNLEQRLRKDPSHRALHAAGQQIHDSRLGVPLIQRLISGGFAGEDQFPFPEASVEDGGVSRGRGKRVCREDYVPPGPEKMDRCRLIGSDGQTFPVGWTPQRKAADVESPASQGISSTASVGSRRSCSAPPGPESVGVKTPQSQGAASRPPSSRATTPAREGSALWQRRVLASAPPKTLAVGLTQTEEKPAVASASVGTQCSVVDAPTYSDALKPVLTDVPILDALKRRAMVRGRPQTAATARPQSAASARPQSAKPSEPGSTRVFGPRPTTATGRRGGCAYSARLANAAATADAVCLSAREHERLRAYATSSRPQSAATAGDWKTQRAAVQRSNSAGGAQGWEPQSRRYLSRPRDTDHLLR